MNLASAWTVVHDCSVDNGTSISQEHISTKGVLRQLQGMQNHCQDKLNIE